MAGLEVVSGTRTTRLKPVREPTLSRSLLRSIPGPIGEVTLSRRLTELPTPRFLLKSKLKSKHKSKHKSIPDL